MGKRPGGDGMVLEVSFTSGQMAKTCSTAALMQRKWGALRAKKMHLRLGQMTAAANLAELMTLPQARCHHQDNARCVADDRGEKWPGFQQMLDVIENQKQALSAELCDQLGLGTCLTD